MTSDRLVRYWFTFDLEEHRPPTVPRGTIRLDGDSAVHRLLWRGIGVTGWDEDDCMQIIAAAVSPDPLPEIVEARPEVDVSTLGLSVIELGVAVWRGIWFPPLNRSGPEPR